jgi:hypothetical protein
VYVPDSRIFLQKEIVNDSMVKIPGLFSIDVREDIREGTYHSTKERKKERKNKGELTNWQ